MGMYLNLTCYAWHEHGPVLRFESTSKMGLNMAGAAVIIPDASDGTDPENPYGDGKTIVQSKQ